MRAGVFRGAGRIDVEEVPDPSAGPGDVLLEVAACGVCGSDLHAWTSGPDDPTGHVMGHEFAGTVLDVGAEVTGIRPGDRLTGLPIQPCGACERCRAGLGHLCAVWTTRSIAFGLPGAFAERLRIPDARLGHNVHRLPDGLPTEHGALVEPFAVAVHAVRRAPVRAGAPALVLGLGPIGLHAGQALRAAGADPVFGLDRSPARLAVAEQLGLVPVADAADLPTGVDVVIEASGAPALVERALAATAPGGTVVLVALYHRAVAFDAMLAVQREVTVRGSANVTPQDFRDALDLLATGRAQVAPLISHRLPLAGIAEAFRTQNDPDASVKVLVTGSDTGSTS
jgi:2-desacetyl-2-hydroxyethyl bacteriochlorophyllide A dehydrogenase